MRKLIFRGPYNLIAFEVLPAMVEARIIEPPSEEFILSYRPPYGPDREVIMHLDVPEEGALKMAIEANPLPPQVEDAIAPESSSEG